MRVSWLRGKLAAAMLTAACAVLAHAQVSVETQDGLKLSLDAGGDVSEIKVGERVLPLLEQPGGFFVTDVARSARNLMPGGDFEQEAG